MHIGIDASRAARPVRTGLEGYSFHLIRALVRQPRPHRYTLYTPSPLPPDLLAGPHVAVRLLPFPRLWTHGRLAWEMARRPPDLLFVPAHVLPVVRPARSVVTVHDLGYLYYPRAHPPLRWLYLYLGTGFNCRAATLLIADSESTRQDLIRHYRVPADRIRVVPLGCDPIYRPLPPDQARAVAARYGLTGPFFLFIGSLHPRKNIGLLLRAFALFRATGRPHHLALAGAPGYQAGQFQTAARRLGLGESVHFLGYVPAEDLPALLNAAVALVFPSLYEGFGLPVLEAMAVGTPVLAARTSSLPEVVGPAGLLLDPHDPAAWAEAMARIADDAGLHADLRARGLARARQFSWERCAAETLAVLEAAAARAG
jgi:glycosyltransferase involved in cell wall biosynthesis